MDRILHQLRLKKTNLGASFGAKHRLKSSHTSLIESINPANEKIIAKVQSCSLADYETVMQNAAQAFLHWRTVPAPKRGEIVRQIGIKLREKKSYLGYLVSLESGKSKAEGEGEVQEMIDMADFAVGQSRMLYGKTMHSERPSHRMYEQWHPLGITGVISAFNFPVAVWAWNAFIAAICGNTVVWKPSPKTPLCAIAVQEICNEVMSENNLSAIFSTFITDDTDLAKTFVADKRIPLISFTGSTQVGIKVYSAVAKRMGRCLLECSGNNALILDESADLKLALPAIIFGAIGTAGQRCTTIRRLIVHECLLDKIIPALKKAYAKITIGDPLNEKNLMGPLIDEQAVRDFEKTVQEIKSLNGEILFGGKKLEKKGYYVQPTLVLAKKDWAILQKETFAPILYVIPYRDFESAIALNNNVSQGLSSALFSNNLKHVESFLSVWGSDCGVANVNISTSGAEIGGAFGGEKDTGGGREAGSDVWKLYMRRQTVTVNWSDTMPLAQGVEFNIV